MDTLAMMRETARERTRRMAVARRQRREKAWAAARAAAALLKSRYHAARVVAFGSLTQVDRFHPWSDVDLAVWGIAPDDYFEAVARVLDAGGEIKVDLVMAERCKPYLREAIEQGTEI
jgi:predicted nucleotidyltransferase